MVIEVRAVSKRFGRQAALRSVDLDAEAGSVIALLGANGAGKTTLLRILATLTQPSRGSYRAFGVDAWERRREVRARLGFVGHRPFIYPELSCAENLAFFARMFGLDAPANLAHDALERVGLDDRADRPASSLSRGLLQRLDLARATLHEPALLVLDEPDTGLDASGRRLLGDTMRQHAERGGLIVFTSHALDFAISTADRIVTLRDGEIAQDSPAHRLTLADLEMTISRAAPLEVAT
ncbi:MAG: heme ABC exporter ATP-binding protein CcmA [Geminicoccales bacterium]